LASPTDFNHKAAVSQKISNYSLIGAGSVTQLGANSVAFTWTNGTPTLTSSNTSAISVAGAGNGFQFTVPADTTKRLLRVYVSAYSARINFEAALSDGSAPVLSGGSFDTTANHQGPVRVYVVQYAATSASQTLTVKCSVLLDEGAGSVSLHAATLQLFPAQTGALEGATPFCLLPLQLT
jgi:hypothetical protein